MKAERSCLRSANIPVSVVLVVGSGGGVESGVGNPVGEGQWVSRDYWVDADWDVRLCVFLFHHVMGGGDGYFGLLPDQVFTAVELCCTVLEEVAYSALVDAVERYRYD